MSEIGREVREWEIKEAPVVPERKEDKPFLEPERETSPEKEKELVPA